MISIACELQIVTNDAFKNRKISRNCIETLAYVVELLLHDFNKWQVNRYISVFVVLTAIVLDFISLFTSAQPSSWFYSGYGNAVIFTWISFRTFNIFFIEFDFDLFQEKYITATLYRRTV